ncbi:unnamed protein product [Camellia sinensis]
MPLLSMPSNICVTENKNYTTCHENKCECGEQIKGIGYPFWGEYRPQFCGVQGFGLTCYGNGSTTIVIQNQTFHALHINQSTHNMTTARADLWDNLCPVELSNTTLNWNLFDYGPHPRVLNLTLFYDCLPELASYDHIQERSHFQCPGGQSSGNINFFVDELLLINPPYCKGRIKVPVFQEGLHAFWGDEHITVEELVKQGFEADYHEMDKFQACDLCNDSGGECGADYYKSSNLLLRRWTSNPKMPR